MVCVRVCVCVGACVRACVCVKQPFDLKEPREGFCRRESGCSLNVEGPKTDQTPYQ